MPGSYGCLVFNKLYLTDTETAIPSHEETVRILEEIRIYGQNTHKQTSDHEHINKLICWYSKNICQSKADEPQNNRVAESAYILRAYISPCGSCKSLSMDCLGNYTYAREQDYFSGVSPRDGPVNRQGGIDYGRFDGVSLW